MRRFWVYMVFWGLCAGIATAQEAPRVRNFAPADYHGQNQNWSLAQALPDGGGWIYVGNNGGVLEFDGSRWQTFMLPEKQTVRTVAVGPRGEVFCGGFAEFGYWATGPNGLLLYHSLSTEVRDDRIGKEEIWHILPGEGFVLFQSFSAIYKYDYKKVTVLHPPGSIMFAQAVEGRIMVPAIGRGMYELLPDNTFRFLAGTELLSDKIVQFIVPDGSGGVWAGTTNHGIFQISGNRCQPWQHPLNEAFQQVQLNKAIPLRQGGWAIGTILNGVYVLDNKGRLKFHLNRENGLQNNTILALCEDREGNLWLGLDRGIDMAILHSPLTFFTDQSGKMGTVYTGVRWQGNLYVGTNQGVFVRENGAFRLVEGTQGQVWQLLVVDGQLLCGHNAGTFRIGPGGMAKISEVTGGWHTIPVPGRPELMLQGTYTGLIVLRRGPTGVWLFDHKVKEFNEPLKKISFDQRGNVWAAHPNKGLFRLRLNADLTEITEFQTFSKSQGLPTDYRLDLASIGDEVFLNAQSVPMRIADSLGRIYFQAVTADGKRQKWLPGRGGDFFLVDSSGVTLHSASGTYVIDVALVPNFENIVPLDDSTYMMCLENGFALLDLRRLGVAPAQHAYPPCVLRQIETPDGQSFLPEPGLAIPYRLNSLKFHFASAFFDRPPQYSLKLDGLSSGWSPWQSSPEKEFINLPAGKYTLRVRTDTGGPEVSFPFRISSPWYLSSWALGVYTLLLIALFGFAEKISQARLARQRQRLDADKQIELARQRAEAEREKLALEVENKSRELSNAALNLIRKNEVLQRLRDDLLHANGHPQALQKLARLIDRHLEGDHDWEVFEESFNRVHDDFFKRLMHQFPDLTPGDLRLAAYLKMNLSSKEVAPLLNISVRGVENKRYRLRKKLGLSEEANLTEFIMAF